MPDEDEAAVHASPPCFMHEFEGAEANATPDPRQAEDVARWRKAERERLLADRRTLDLDARRRCAERIAAELDQAVGPAAGLIVGGYWPIRGEPDLRDWMARMSAAGARCALPVVVKPRTPLVYRAWTAGDPLVRGVWNIPVPAEGEEVIPDVVLAPLVGFDRASFRLGYGGGFFDRTLAALPKRPVAIGVGYASAAIPTIYPQPHDIPMAMIVTDDGRL